MDDIETSVDISSISAYSISIARSYGLQNSWLKHVSLTPAQTRKLW